MMTDFWSLSPNGKTRTNMDSFNEYPDKTPEEALQRVTLIPSAQDAKGLSYDLIDRRRVERI
jgi:hypothetical protein